jgi:hypothetical protein
MRRLDFTDSLVVVVGEHQKRYVLHTFAVKTSEYFKTAMNGKWKETETKELSLPEFKPEVFEMYAQWLYTTQIPLFDAAGSEDSDYITCLAHSRLVELYILALYLMNNNFQNAVIDKILRTEADTNLIPGLSVMAKAWINTPALSQLRRLLVRFLAKKMQPEEVIEACKYLPLDMVLSIMKDLVRIREDPKKTWIPSFRYRCDYHVHDETTPEGPQCDPHAPSPAIKAN